MTQFNYSKYYEKYWNNGASARRTDSYHEFLYGRLKKNLSMQDNFKTIDIGGGTGHLMHWLGIRNGTVFDVSSSGFDIAKQLGYKTIKGNVLNMHKIKKDSFDIAYCFEVAEHLEYPNHLFNEINRILKRGGLMFLSIPNGSIDGIHHKKRWGVLELLSDLDKAKFSIMWVNNNPKFYPIGKSNNTLKSKMIWLIGKIIPDTIKFWLCYYFTTDFSSMYILCCKKISD